MKQTKQKSFIEAIINTGVGLIITLTFSPLVYWIVGAKVTASQMTAATAMFTVISIVRNYIIRRWFNKNK